jgi:WD40 repeat protein
MTRWLALGLVLICGVVVQAQTAGVIEEIVGLERSLRPLRPNPLGGGLVPMAMVQVVAQPAPLPPPGGGPPPNANAIIHLPSANRRPVRSRIVPIGPVKLDQYGDPLPPGALTRYGSTRLRHGPEPLGLGFSHDGKMLGSISQTEDGIRLWDPATGKELYRFNSPAMLAAFARDGSLLVVDENRCRVWIPAANHIRDLPEKILPENLQVIAVHPDCRSFVAGTPQKILQINLQTGKLIRELKCPGEQIPLRLVFSSDGHWLAGSGQKTGVWLWDLHTGKRVRTYHTEFDFPEYVFNSDGTRIAIAAEQLRIYPTDSEEVIEDYKVPAGVFQNPRFSGDGKWVFGITPDGNFFQINANTGEAKDLGNSPDVTLRPPMAIAPEGAFAAATDQSGAIRIWDPKTGKGPEVDRLPLLSDPGFSPDGKTVWCLATDGRVHAFETATGKRIKVIDLPVDEDTPVSWEPAARRAIAINGGDELELQVIDVDTNRVINKINVPTNGVIPLVAFCATDRSRAAVFGMGTVAVINVTTGKLIRSLSVGKAEEMQTCRGAISPDGRLVAISTHPLSLWEVSTGKKRFDLDAVLNAAGAIFSPDGHYLAGWDAVGNIVVFDVRLGTIVRRIQTMGADNAGMAVAFSADAKWLAAGDQDGGITVWDLATGDVLGTFDRHDGFVTGLAFSPDGTKLASTAQDGTVLVWEVTGKRPGKMSDIEVGGLDEAFRLLASSEASHAQRGMEFLYRRPLETIKLCGERIAVPTAISADKVAKVIADLDSDDFPVRQVAVKELEAFGGEVIPALRTVAEKSSNPEARKLAAEVIARHEAASLKSDDLRFFRAVELLENIGTPDARALLAKWAGGPAGHRMSNEAIAAISRLKSREK